MSPQIKPVMTLSAARLDDYMLTAQRSGPRVLILAAYWNGTQKKLDGPRNHGRCTAVNANPVEHHHLPDGNQHDEVQPSLPQYQYDPTSPAKSRQKCRPVTW